LIIKGINVFLKLLNADDVTLVYFNWMQDANITKYLESRWRNYTLDDLKTYVTEINNSQTGFLFGIFQSENAEHIGNVKIGGINQIHRYGDLGILIGNKKMWGKGYAVEAINLITQYGFNELNLNKLVAGIYKVNENSYKAFIKAGYKDVGILTRHNFCGGNYVDTILVEKVKDSI